jgi:ATP-dependent Clp protease ATP-binding subunit ClpA
MVGVMFERFTDRARRVVVLAQEEARRLQHNYIGTEHILLALIREQDGIAARALDRFGLNLNEVRDEVKERVGTGTAALKGHIPFTPRAKKVLELALGEALRLGHNYIGTEHILLGVIREGDGVGAQILKEHSADLQPVRDTVIELLHGYTAARGGRRLARRIRSVVGAGGLAPAEDAADQPTTPAADTSLTEAARLAGEQPVGSHHLMLAALSDPNAAAAKALVALGVDLDRAREALLAAEVTGTSDELPEHAGRRQMLIRVADDKVTIEAADPDIIKLGLAAAESLGDQADPPGTIRGDHRGSASLSELWLALRDSLQDISRRADGAGDSPEDEKPASGADGSTAGEEGAATKPGKPGEEVA